LAAWHTALDCVEEAEELLVAVALHALPDHRHLEHIERDEQRGRAVALVVMMGCTSPRLRLQRT
jgi:hypothetical protein